MVKYFQSFPIIQYTFAEARNQFFTVRNIFARTKLLNSILQNALIYYQYPVQDSDTPEIIASKYYGDPNRYWMIMFANQMIDPYFDWVLNQKDLENNIVLKYGSLANAQGTLHHVEQQQTVTTTLNGSSNTIIYTSTANGYSYNFQTKILRPQTIPSIQFPTLDLGSTTVGFSDGSVVVTDTSLQAVSCYDFEISQNEAKRQIVLIDRQYAGQIEQEFVALMST